VFLDPIVFLTKRSPTTPSAISVIVIVVEFDFFGSATGTSSVSFIINFLTSVLRILTISENKLK
jgi:hypothetical protein